MEIKITDMVRVCELKDCKAVVKWLKSEKYHVSEMQRLVMSKYPSAFGAIQTEVTVYGKREIVFAVLCYANSGKEIVQLFVKVNLDIEEFTYTVEDSVLSEVYKKQ